ncbi:uncharacterized protein A4U43_C01F27380 [Asparagus officinalis]|uniref:RING-type E3 ubiquitin transferase n=1 Tax=Asparagus officinalis TaxID=4686 RepID=A0A5P1FUE1_ASPOF|nr:U-box domain-containing protein 5-like [Asparagus officinalis]ONK81283.1 uncharacterized protein A4U43_C01F27380 [Asparagus officinalis]
MGSDASEAIQIPQNSSCVKVHDSICWELKKILDKIIAILPAIESARPGYTAGIQELCCLNNTIEKAKLLIQHCAESSKLYLAITGESVVLRCERIRSSLNKSLCHVQNMVPQMLADQISGVLDYLREARFVIDPDVDEAGKAMLELLGQTDSSEELELNAFQIAVACLKITSPKALLIERRSIKKLLEKIHGSDPKKERILNYFLFLIKKYGKKVNTYSVEHKDNLPEDKCSNMFTISPPNFGTHETSDEHNHVGETQKDSIVSNVPQEFCCPISSRLMYDPVVIASGQTFERVSIEKWFSEGHDTCPMTLKKLKDLYMIPNSSMKDLISNWCRKHGINLEDPSVPIQSWDASNCSSISSLRNVSAALLDGNSGKFMLQSDHSSASFISSDASYCSDSSHTKRVDSLNDVRAHLFSSSDDYLRCESFSNFTHDMYLRFFSRVCELPLNHQDKAIKDLESLFVSDEELCYAMLSNGFEEALMTFLRDASNLRDIHAQRTGAQIFLAFLSNTRVEIPALSEDTFQLLTSFLESEITFEALMILQTLSHHPNSKSIMTVSDLPPSIVKILDHEDHRFLDLSIKILFDISSHTDLRPHIISSGCIQKLVPLLHDGRLAELCLKILHNLSDIKEATVLIAETDGCIASIVELLETGNHEEQENGVAILHSLCSQSLEYCLLVMKEGVIPSLVNISVNGNAKGKENSMKLLHLLKDLRLSGSFEISDPQSESTSELASEESVDYCVIKQPSSKSSGFFRKKMRFFLKPRAVPLS